MANLFPDIVPGTTTGAVSASALNNLGRSDESSMKVVSGSANLTTDTIYYKEGSLALTKDTSKIYELTSGSWVDSGSVIASANHVFLTGDIKQVELYRETLSGSGIFDYPTSGSISQDYDRLRIILCAKSSVADWNDRVLIFFNNDTTVTNYAFVNMSTRTGGAASRESGDSPDLFLVGAANSSTYSDGQTILDICRYSSTDNYKVISGQMVMRDDNYVWTANLSVQWENISAINRITIQPDGHPTDMFTQGSFLQIIGIKTV